MLFSLLIYYFFPSNLMKLKKDLVFNNY